MRGPTRPRLRKAEAGARPAVEHEGQRPRSVVRLRNIGGVEDRGRTLARLIEQRKRARGRGIGQLPARRVDACSVTESPATARARPARSAPAARLRMTPRRPGGRVAPARMPPSARPRSTARGNGPAKIDHLFCSFSILVHLHRPAIVPERWLSAAPLRKMDAPTAALRAGRYRDRIGEVLGPNGRAPVIGAPARRAAAKDRSPQLWLLRQFRPDAGSWSRPNAVPAGVKSPDPFHRARPHAGAGRADLRAPARRLGRQRHQDRSAARTRKSRWAGRARAPDFQNLHRNKRSITLNLKAPEGARRVQAHGEEGRRGGREFPARREEAARHRLQDAGARSIRASSTPASPASARMALTPTGRASTRSRRAWAG